MSDNPHDKTMTIRVREDGVYEVRLTTGQVVLTEKLSTALAHVGAGLARHELWLKWIKEKDGNDNSNPATQ